MFSYNSEVAMHRMVEEIYTAVVVRGSTFTARVLVKKTSDNFFRACCLESVRIHARGKTFDDAMAPVKERLVQIHQNGGLLHGCETMGPDDYKLYQSLGEPTTITV